MDILSDLLDILRIQSTSMFRATLRAPWGFSVDAQSGVAPSYIVAKGACRLELESRVTSVRLAAGDLVLLPHGEAHIVRAEPGDAPIPLTDMLAQAGAGVSREVHVGENGAETVLIVGAFHLEPRSARLLFPVPGPFGPVQMDASRVGAGLETLTSLICAEATTSRPGAALAVSRLMDLLLLQLVRVSMTASMAADAPEHGSFLRALADPHLAKVLELIHQRPAYPWTVATLAAHIGMSRTAFATSFAATAGIPPLMYLRQWRMLHASDALRRGEATLDEIAERVGYNSAAAFAKAFKREIGVTPGAYRQQWLA